ncbi:MAG TPA: thiamine pyrophosphate-binding protein, partial [Thermaerobacter sp.]
MTTEHWEQPLADRLRPFEPALVVTTGAPLPAPLAAAAADGAARATGRPAVVLAGSGAELNAMLPALAVADADSVPLIVLVRAGTAADLEAGRERPGALPDALRLTEPVTGWNTRVDRPEDLDLVLEAAFTDLARRRPRPLLIELAAEAVPRLRLVEREGAAGGRVIPFPGDGLEPGATSTGRGVDPVDRRWIDQVAAALVRGRQPVIVAGGGAAEAASSLRQLAEALGTPVFLTLAGRGLLPAHHPLVIEDLAAAPARRFLEEADVLLVVGTTLSPAEHGDLNVKGRVVHIDRDV